MENYSDKNSISESKNLTSSALIKKFVVRLAMFLVVFYSTSTVIYLFSDENRLTDRNAKIFVEDLLKSDLVIHQPVCEDRREVFQRILKHQNKHFSYLFLGSSRILQFGKQTGYENALNVGLLGATLEDILITDSLVNQYGITADTVFFEFSPWFVDSGTDDRHRQFIFKENFTDALKRILQFDHGWNNLETCFPKWTNNYQGFKEVEHPENFRRKFSDGSSARKPISVKKRKLEIEHFVTALYQMNKFHKIHNDRLNLLVNTIKKSSIDRTTVVVLSPFHPDLFGQKSKDSRVQNMLASEELLRVHLPESIPVIGSFIPEKTGFVVSDFYDGLHLTDEAVRTKLRLH